MADDQHTPTDGELFEALMRSARVSVEVSIPAVVTAVDLAARRVSVRPVVRKPLLAGGTPQRHVDVVSVPIRLPAGGPYAMGFPVAVGDLGRLIACDRPIGGWLDGDGSDVDPDDGRRHNINESVWEPGLYPWSQAPSLARSDGAWMGKADGSTYLLIKDTEIAQIANAVRLASENANKAVAIAERVDARITTIQTNLDTHVHPVPGVFPGPGATTSLVQATPIGPQATVASTKVFAED